MSEQKIVKSYSLQFSVYLLAMIFLLLIIVIL